MSRYTTLILLLFILLALVTSTATASNSYLYVSNISGNNVSVVNGSTGQIIASIPVPQGPNGIAVTPDGTAAYVVSQSANSVSVINTATNSITNTIGVGSVPVHIAVSPNGALAYVVNQGSDNVSVINTATKSVTATIGVGTHPNGVAFSPDGSQAYITNLYSGTLSIINTASGTVSNSFPANNGPASVAISPNGIYAYVANQYSGTVTVHAAATGNIVATISGFNYPNCLAITPNGNNVFVTNGNSASVSVISTASNSTIANIATGMLPAAVAISTDGTEAYVINELGLSLSMINTSTLALENTVARVGVYPVFVATTPASVSGPVCTYSISPGSATYGSSGGSGTISVTAPSGCSWNAASNIGWASITSGASGSGNGSVNYLVSSDNTANGQNGTLTIAGRTFTLSEGGIACSYSLSSNSTSLASAGGTGTVTVTASSGCRWTAASNSGFLSVTSGASGNGTGSVGYLAMANLGVNGETGSLTIANQTFTVTESGIACTYSLSSSGVSLGSAGGSGSVTVTAPPGCLWPAVSNANFVSITSGASGNGTGSVGYLAVANPALGGETGTLTIAGQTFTVTESGIACTYSLSTNGVSLGTKGGTGAVTVTAPSGCPWTAASNSGFVSVTSGAGGNGTGTVGFSAAANAGLDSETGTLTIATHTFTVSEAGNSFSPIYVNCGGAAYKDAGNHVWAADNTGNISSTSNAIANSSTPALYQSDKWSTGTLQYQYSVPNGTYNVTLKFAEYYLMQAGQRQANIKINGTIVHPAFDILAYTSPNTAYDLTLTVVVSNGQITLQLVPVVGTAKLNGLEIAAQ